MEAVVSIQWAHSGVPALLNGQVKDVKQVSVIIMKICFTAKIHLYLEDKSNTSKHLKTFLCYVYIAYMYTVYCCLFHGGANNEHLYISNSVFLCFC